MLLVLRSRNPGVSEGQKNGRGNQSGKCHPEIQRFGELEKLIQKFLWKNM
jgi:hypothetical protein